MIYVAPSAVIVGDVTIGSGSSVWHGAVLRGDLDRIVVGENTSLQDNCVVHVDQGFPAILGNRITVGHAAVIHGCTVEDDCLIGMNASVASRARIGRGSIVAAGAVVPERTEFPPSSIIAGVPGRRLGDIREQHRLRIQLSWQIYAELAAKSLPAVEGWQANPSNRVRIPLADEFGKLL